ncbi:hypothetical protein H7U19_08130 [Hyunsoonleella sp. SJ7]|uniref:Uncharacterized protein n=1 Tax=Hyunsoonleella aquatilis TaxID=2762758 RepID=A0A923HAV4_9FLAO|nr:hypothetical protein [Hyunsoonleella aquatilis]MBC3758367.1 hypothetical protein [Hyunsoonleella aquatilis]
MNLKHVSIFNLIEIFRGKRKSIVNTISPKTHCEQKHIHDFYCDAEMPYITKGSVA